MSTSLNINTGMKFVEIAWCIAGLLVGIDQEVVTTCYYTILHLSTDWRFQAVARICQ
jgi:hypothetical protein